MRLGQPESEKKSRPPPNRHCPTPTEADGSKVEVSALSVFRPLSIFEFFFQQRRVRVATVDNAPLYSPFAQSFLATGKSAFSTSTAWLKAPTIPKTYPTPFRLSTEQPGPEPLLLFRPGESDATTEPRVAVLAHRLVVPIMDFPPDETLMDRAPNLSFCHSPTSSPCHDLSPFCQIRFYLNQGRLARVLCPRIRLFLSQAM